MREDEPSTKMSIYVVAFYEDEYETVCKIIQEDNSMKMESNKLIS